MCYSAESKPTTRSTSASEARISASRSSSGGTGIARRQQDEVAKAIDAAFSNPQTDDERQIEALIDRVAARCRGPYWSSGCLTTRSSGQKTGSEKTGSECTSQKVDSNPGFRLRTRFDVSLMA